MRIVVYDEYLEPITVVSLPRLTDADIETHGRFYRLPVPEPLPTVSYIGTEPLAVMERLRTVDLKFEPIRRGPYTGWLCFTKQDEWAMLLDSALLPGQRRDFRDLREENAALSDTVMRLLLKGLRG